MSWFRNHYQCGRCSYRWSDEWSANCDDDCPECGARHTEPTDSDDLTVIVEEKPDGSFAILRSPETAEHQPDYEEIAHFETEAAAQAFVEDGNCFEDFAPRPTSGRGR